MSVLMLGGSAIVPSLLLLWYVYARDKNPEPRALLLKTFLLGAFICAPVVPVALALERMGQGFTGGMWGDALVKAFLGAAIPEELFKFLVLRWYVWRKTHFDEPLDGVVYGATASLGFATLENILYVGSGGLETAVLRALTAVPVHAFTGVVMGAFLGRARFAEEPGQRSALIWMGLGSAILLHGAYNAFLFTGSDFAVLAVAVLFIEVRWGRKLYKQLQAEQVMASQSVLAGALLAGPVPMAQPALMAPLGALMAGGGGSEALHEPELPSRAVRHGPPERTFRSWFKLVLGGVGLSLCGLWWLAVAAVLFFPDASEPVPMGGMVGLAMVSAIPTLICLSLFRSGLRGPFEPSATR